MLIRNETKESKMDDEFKRSGKVIKVLGQGCIKVNDETGRQIRRHVSQLRLVKKGDVGSTDPDNMRNDQIISGETDNVSDKISEGVSDMIGKVLKRIVINKEWFQIIHITTP